MQVKKRLQLNVLISVLAAAAILLVLVFAMYRVSKAVEASDIAGKLVTISFERATLRSDYRQNGSERAKGQWFAKHGEIERLLASATEKFRDPADQKTIADLIADQESGGRIFSDIVKNREKAHDPTRLGELSQETEERLITQMNMINYGLVLQARRLLESSRETFFSTLRLAGWGITGVLALVMAAVIANSWIMGRSISGRVQRLRDGAAAIGGGNLDHRIEVKGEDELAELSGAFNAMTAKLQGSYQEMESEIAERRRAEAALDASQRHWMTTLASIGDAVIATDATGRITFMNPVAQALTGWGHEEALGQPAQDVFRIIDEKSREPGEDIVGRVIAEGKVVALANHTALVVRDGREVSIEDSAAPIRNREGDIDGVVLVFHDVSERRRTQEALRESENIYRTVGEALDYGIWICERDGNVRYFSPSFLNLVGMKDSEVKEYGCTTLQLPEDAEPVIQKWAECCRLAGFWDAEHRILGTDGNYRIILSRGKPVYDSHGEISAWAGINLDITERKRAEKALAEHAARLEAVNRELENYSYSVSHDLRVPLRAIDGYARMILIRQGDRFDEETRRRFEAIRESVGSMEKLIDDLLVFSRLGRQEVAPVTIDMEGLVKELWRERVAANPGRELSLSVGAVPAARADRAMVRQVLRNLLDNAVKFTRERKKAEIEVGSHVMNIETVYYVKDNGIGFDMKYYDRLFGVFQRLPSAEGYEGTGMDLALAQRIIHKHGGRIWAEGKVDEGATFYFTLPG